MCEVWQEKEVQWPFIICHVGRGPTGSRQCAVYTLNVTLLNVHCTLFTVQCTLSEKGVQWTLLKDMCTVKLRQYVEPKIIYIDATSKKKKKRKKNYITS